MCDEFQLSVECPIDGARAVVARAADGKFFCSHRSADKACPSKCGARAVLYPPEKSERMMIVCPSDGEKVKVVVKNGDLSWCSHQKDKPGCGLDCVSRVGKSDSES